MKWINWIIAALGLWEFGDIAALFVPSFGIIPVYLWNHIVIGLIMMIVGVSAALTRNVRTARTMNWVAAAAGAWLVIATLLLRSTSEPAGMLNDISVGVIAMSLAAWAALKTTRAAS
jgi:hypothetical protein